MQDYCCMRNLDSAKFDLAAVKGLVKDICSIISPPADKSLTIFSKINGKEVVFTSADTFLTGYTGVKDVNNLQVEICHKRIIVIISLCSDFDCPRAYVKVKTNMPQYLEPVTSLVHDRFKTHRNFNRFLYNTRLVTLGSLFLSSGLGVLAARVYELATNLDALDILFMFSGLISFHYIRQKCIAFIEHHYPYFRLRFN